MSVAYDYLAREALPGIDLSGSGLPDWDVPAVPVRDGGRLASVSVLHAPVERSAAPLRLTRRGQVVVALAVALLGGALLWLASASRPAASAQVHVPSSVTVRSGDTLWSIASAVSPQGDPGAVVARIEKVNHLSGVDLTPGQVLRVR